MSKQTESDRTPLLTHKDANSLQRNAWLNDVQRRLRDVFMWQLFLLQFYGTVSFAVLDSLQGQSDPTTLYFKLTTCSDNHNHDQAMKRFVDSLSILGSVGHKAINATKKHMLPLPPDDGTVLQQYPFSGLIEVIVQSLLKMQHRRKHFLRFLNGEYLGGVPHENDLDKHVFSTFTDLFQRKERAELVDDCLVLAFRHIHATRGDLEYFNQYRTRNNLRPIEEQAINIIPGYGAVVYSDSASTSAAGVQRTISGSSDYQPNTTVGRGTRHTSNNNRKTAPHCCGKLKLVWIAMVLTAIPVLLAAVCFLLGGFLYTGYNARVYGIANTNVILRDRISSFWYSFVEIRQTLVTTDPSVSNFLPSNVYLVPSSDVHIYDSPPETVCNVSAQSTDDSIVNVIEVSLNFFAGDSFNYSLYLDPLNLTLYSTTFLLFTDQIEFEKYQALEDNTDYICAEPVCQERPFKINATEPSCHNVSFVAPRNSYYFLITTIKSSSKGILFSATVVQQEKFLNESDYTGHGGCSIGDDVCKYTLSSGLPTNSSVYELLAFIQGDFSDPNAAYFNVAVKQSQYVLVYSTFFACAGIFVVLCVYVLYCCRKCR